MGARGGRRRDGNTRKTPGSIYVKKTKTKKQREVEMYSAEDTDGTTARQCWRGTVGLGMSTAEYLAKCMHRLRYITSNIT